MQPPDSLRAGKVSGPGLGHFPPLGMAGQGPGNHKDQTAQSCRLPRTRLPTITCIYQETHRHQILQASSVGQAPFSATTPAQLSELPALTWVARPTQLMLQSAPHTGHTQESPFQRASPPSMYMPMPMPMPMSAHVGWQLGTPSLS